MRGAGLRPGILTASVALAAGCGDPPLCQSQVFVAFAPVSLATDLDATAPGVQTDIRVRTSLEAGELVDLEVLTEQGASLGVVRAPAEDDGSVRFRGVSVPEGRVVLRAVGEGMCGLGRDELTVDVLGGAGCALRFLPEPEPGGYYAPLGVLSTRSDLDPVTPGHQSKVVVSTWPGWTAEVFQITGQERSLGAATADRDGVAALPIDVMDGEVGFRAICHGPGADVVSRTTSFLVDTTPPSCALVAPVAGATITPSFDENHDLGDGLQLAVRGRAGGGDVDNEPVGLTMTGPDGVALAVPASTTDPDGMTTALATLAPATTPATFAFALTMRDHAGNACTSTASFDVVFHGCELAVISPTSPISVDADRFGGNGSQVDVTLAVAPACAGRTVTASCGTASPSAIVRTDGRAVMRLDICATSPCEAQTHCTFRVSTATGVQTETAATIAFDDQPPAVTASVIAPAVACGGQVTRAVDVDPATAGVQITARVTSTEPGARSLVVTSGAGTSVLGANADVSVTLAAGKNRLVGVGLDALGNRGVSPPCEVRLAAR